MAHNFSTLDYIVFIMYALIILGVGLYVSRNKGKGGKTAEEYFLAGKTLPWWAIGASLIAANISAEQFIGMSGSGFAIGLAIASYEWMAAITLIIVAKYFLPVFLKQGLFTIPQFIEKRYNTRLKTILAVFWLGLFVFVNLTSVLFLGAKALDTIIGTGNRDLIMPFMIGLAFFAAAYSLRGGLLAVAWTDVIQVGLLVLGGLMTTYIALRHVTPDGNAFKGLTHTYEAVRDKFHMILDKDNPQYVNLPGISVLIGGMWVANLYYWGFNQYIIQRALAAKSLREAQKGLVFASFLKLLIPLIVVIPGIIAYVFYAQGEGTVVIDGIKAAFAKADGSIDYDRSYPWLINRFIPVGIKGLVVSALAAAILSSLASMLNSAATIFTMDIYKNHINKKATDKKLVYVGRVAVLAALIVAVYCAQFLESFPQMFIYIQEWTGLVSPGILAVFLMGLFWKKTNAQGATVGVILSIPVAMALKFLPIQMPFLDQMFYTLIMTIVIIVGVSLSTGQGDDDKKAVPLFKETFNTDKVFNVAAYTIMFLLAILYTVFW